MKIKFGIKIKWNQMIMDENKEKLINKIKGNQRNEDQIWYKK
jgi:hypothetical protein